jgi:hypothetical protein
MNIFQEGAKKEGNLHRLLMSKILTSFGRTPASRPAKISMSQCTGMNQQTIVILIIYQIEFTLLQEEGQQHGQTQGDGIHDLQGLVLFEFIMISNPNIYPVHPRSSEHGH